MTTRCPDGMFPNGHFYSPVIDPAEVEAASAPIWPAQPDVRGIEFDREG
jgi:hypothetical protein